MENKLMEIKDTKFYDIWEFMYACFTYIGSNKQKFIDDRLTKNLLDLYDVSTLPVIKNKEGLKLLSNPEKIEQVVSIINQENLEGKPLIQMVKVSNKPDARIVTWSVNTRLPWEFFKPEYRVAAIGDVWEAVIDFIEMSEWPNISDRNWIAEKILAIFPGLKNKILDRAVDYVLELIDSVYYEENELAVAEGLEEEKELNEGYFTTNSSLPNILNQNDILNFLKNVTKATTHSGPLKFKLGYLMDVELNEKYAIKKSRKNAKKVEEPVEVPQEEKVKVTIKKATEYSRCYLEEYESAKNTKKAFAQQGKDINTDVKSRNGFSRYSGSEEENPDDPALNVRCVFSSAKDPNRLAVGLLLDSNTKTNTTYFISINDGPFANISYEDVLEYIKVKNYSSFVPKFDEEGKEIQRPQRTQTFYLDKIYAIGSENNHIGNFLK